MPEWDEKSIFAEALTLTGEARAAFLRRVCPNDGARERIETLLRHHSAAPEDFLLRKEDSTTPPPGAPDQIDEFRILHRLGEGGMGVVYLAEDTILNRRVALKLLSSELAASDRAVERFREEARSAAQVAHPAIVPVFKLGTSGNRDYIVSEFIDGPTLRDEIIARQRVLDDSVRDMRAWIHRTADVVAVIADALSCAHEAGIVHRDVKPSNVLIDPLRGPRLTDFGIAKHFGNTEVTHTVAIGSCHYMSPEQARIQGSRIDHRSDIFSLGVVLYEMLTLRRPFEGDTVHEVLVSVETAQPARVRSLNKQVPTDLETICLKAMEKVPERRYPSATHMGADLRSFRAGQPILAKPPSWSRKAVQWLGRHRIRVSVAGTAIVLAILVAVILEVRRTRREAAASLSVQASTAPLDVRGYLMDPDSLEWPAFPTFARSGSFQFLLLDPGYYRIVILAGSSFAEFNVSLAAGSGSATTLSVPWPLAGSSRPTNVLLDDRRHVPRTLYAMPGPQVLTEQDEMVLIPAGEYGVGWADGDSDPVIRRQRVRLRPFYIDRYEVTNREYKEFVEATGHHRPGHWEKFGYDDALADRPVVNVTVEDAEAYARWHGKRLPSMFEWEVAMRYPDGRLLPWTGEAPSTLPRVSVDQIFRIQRADIHLAYEEYAKHTMPARAHPQLATPAGLHHAASNVAELTATIATRRSNSGVRKGASWIDPPAYYDLSSSWTAPAESSSMVTGFRCARSAEP